MKKPSINGEKLKSGLKRAAWLFVALLFLVSALGAGIYYFWQAANQDDQVQNQAQSQNTLKGKPLENYTPVADVESLQKIDQSTGNGAEAKADSTVTVIYTGALASTGIVFESSVDSGQPVSFKLSDVIDGWKEGLLGMKAGGQRRLLIPSDKAYGAYPPPTSGIPPNTDLVFDVTLLAIQ